MFRPVFFNDNIHVETGTHMPAKSKKDKNLRLLVRKLYRTSLPIPHAGGQFPAKPPINIIGGILTFESDWTPGMGEALKTALNETPGAINLGCIAAHGHIYFKPEENGYEFVSEGKPATAFLFKLISILQFSGTVPMIDVMEYSKWLVK